MCSTTTGRTLFVQPLYFFSFFEGIIKSTLFSLNSITVSVYVVSIEYSLIYPSMWSMRHTTSTVVVDSVTGTPLPRASVFDRHGKLAGIGNDRGELPALSDEDYPITVRFMGRNKSNSNKRLFNNICEITGWCIFA